jgi:hypothetical protein
LVSSWGFDLKELFQLRIPNSSIFHNFRNSSGPLVATGAEDLKSYETRPAKQLEDR